MCDSVPRSRFMKVIGRIRKGQCHFPLPEVRARGWNDANGYRRGGEMEEEGWGGGGGGRAVDIKDR